jgi:hypothetical protein
MVVKGGAVKENLPFLKQMVEEMCARSAVFAMVLSKTKTKTKTNNVA